MLFRSSTFLIKQVKEKGWLYIGNIAFESAVAIMNPAMSGGRICLSPSGELVFGVSCMDTHNTHVIENTYLGMDFSNAGIEQSIIAVGFERLQQFDIMLMSQTFRTTPDGSAFVAPKIIKYGDVESLVADEATGLYPGTDTMTTYLGKQESMISVYSKGRNVKDYIGIRVKEYQKFVKTQKMFCNLIRDMFGYTDCI